MLLQSQDGVRTILGSYIWRWSPKAIGNDDDHLCKEVIFKLLNGQYIWAGLTNGIIYRRWFDLEQSRMNIHSR